MPDREKTISDLQKVVDVKRDALEIDGLILNPFVIIPLMKDALALLKEQDGVDHALEVLRKDGWKEVQDISPVIGGDESGTWYLVCPACRMAVDYKDAYCRHCGRKFVWNEFEKEIEK